MLKYSSCNASPALSAKPDFPRSIAVRRTATAMRSITFSLTCSRHSRTRAQCCRVDVRALDGLAVSLAQGILVLKFFILTSIGFIRTNERTKHWICQLKAANVFHFVQIVSRAHLALESSSSVGRHIVPVFFEILVRCCNLTISNKCETLYLKRIVCIEQIRNGLLFWQINALNLKCFCVKKKSETYN